MWSDWYSHESDKYVFSGISFTGDEYGDNRDISVQHSQPVHCTAFVYRQIYSVVNSESVQFYIISKSVRTWKENAWNILYCFIFLYSVNVIVSCYDDEPEPSWYCVFCQFLSHALAHYKDVRTFHQIMINPALFNQQSITELFLKGIINHSNENH